MTTSTASEPIGSIFLRGLKVAAISAVINVVLFFLGSAAGLLPETVLLPGPNEPLTVIPVIFSSIAGTLAGTVLYVLLCRFSRASSSRIFRITLLVLGIATLFPPLSIPGAPIGMVLTLELMHIVTIVGMYVGLPRTS